MHCGPMRHDIDRLLALCRFSSISNAGSIKCGITSYKAHCANNMTLHHFPLQYGIGSDNQDGSKPYCRSVVFDTRCRCGMQWRQSWLLDQRCLRCMQCCSVWWLDRTIVYLSTAARVNMLSHQRADLNCSIRWAFGLLDPASGSRLPDQIGLWVAPTVVQECDCSRQHAVTLCS